MKSTSIFALASLGFAFAVAVLAVSPAVNVRFTDVTEKAGIHFTHHSGATGKKYLPETLGAGCAFIDLDGDGWADILLINGTDLSAGAHHFLPAFYHNNHNGTFTDVTRGSGLDVEMYGMGVAVADYDNDGLPDVYVTALGGDHLFHNEGHGHFRDVTAQSGIRNANFGTSAAWFDYDKDGKADLFVANYVTWSKEKDLWCSLDGATKSYCTPESYTGTSSKLFHNLGNGKFEDVTEKAGLGDKTSKSLGVVIFDFNNDGWPDIFVSNDTQPSKLYKNNGNGTFTEVGMQAGVAFGEDGVARGAMGVDAIDYDHSGKPHLLVGNFANQMIALYHNEGNGFFVDEAPSSTIGRASLLSLTFGAFFFDYDLDGWDDILAANGHIEPDINRIQPKVSYRESPLLFHNQGHGRFENVSNDVGPDFRRQVVARGAAYADYDHDGDLDVIINNNDGPPVLFNNEGGNRNNWLCLRLNGTKSNRSGLGAIVRVQDSTGKQWKVVHSGSSYCSQSDLALTFGLGRDTAASVVAVEWPSGRRQQFQDVAA
ncbi:MAG: CRTAC1 family protein, partial [Acidobacteriaceae bacterium]|nr:CRTAC1 family protein [Acidobacteriaceae bacterium]